MSDDEIYQYWRKELSGEVLGEAMDNARICGHEGSCWDCVNDISKVLVEPTKKLVRLTNPER